MPHWVLEEAAGRRAVPEPWRGWSPAEPPRFRRRRLNWTGVGGAVLVVLIGALGLVASHVGLTVPAAGASGFGGPGFPHPTPGVESADAPLGNPMAAPADGGSYGFTRFQADGVSPVAYDPCRPIHYVVRPDNQPADGDQVIDDAVATISQLTGLAFIDDGATDETPSEQRPPFQPGRYGDRWAPVLISWDTVAEKVDLVGDVAGLGGSQALSVGDGPVVYVTGTVDLDAAQFDEILTRPDGELVARALVLHELGHVLGLAHVNDPTQLMYPQGQQGVVDFQAGDRAGLARLGAGACAPEL